MTTFLQPVVEGETEEIEHTLLSDEQPFPIFGLTVTLVLEKKDGTVIDTSAKVTIIDDGTAPLRGKVSFSPAEEDFVKAESDLYLRWKVVDGAGKVIFWPSGGAPRIRIYPVAK